MPLGDSAYGTGELLAAVTEGGHTATLYRILANDQRSIAEVVMDYSVDKYVATACAPVKQSEANCVVQPANVSQRGNAVSPQQQTENSMLYGSAQPPEQYVLGSHVSGHGK